ncbi:DegT/DnrJ/EryC1/StrS family aminotransferase [Flammeovirga pacifica]|uniref:Aminotransferase n=1 Tax=Flammeovirga pacifica TaxID=915059 RepID=A0A1S1YZE2_FLAPC|nr:DegT/DnrJ/EryC1/StrS family aminotransferase [Flammeovirga pacifica]OHX66370.1 aminotransferase [Flammeovirga pacifica]
MKVPFLTLEPLQNSIRSEAFDTFTKIYNESNYILGNELKAFELSYAQYNATKYCVGVGNGFDALKIALMALDIKEGDEVILPSNSFYASVLAVLSLNATPVFVDVSLEDGLINPLLIEENISDKTKAILVVNLYGFVVNMDQILKLVSKHQLYLIEDNAQAQGAEWKQKKAGSFGHISATSFYPGKNLGALGDAGAINMNNKELYDKCIALRNYGSKTKYVHDSTGVNSRLDELQAGFLNVKLKYLDKWNIERRFKVDLYIKYLKNVRGIVLFKPKDVCLPVYHVFTIQTEKRDELQSYLKNKGIGTQIHYPIPMHLQEGLSHLNYKKGDFPIAEKIASTTLSLPLFIGITEKQIEYVCHQIKLFFDLA